MAPEEILSSADASRRDFLKKVLAGTTFAAPVIASFSMEGLAPESAWASNCSNMPSSDCCAFAARITLEIALFGAQFTGLDAQVDVKALLLGPLGKAQAAMAEGIEKGNGDCTNAPAQAQFKKAAKELGRFKDLADTLCADVAGDLDRFADTLIGQITDLLDGNCSFPA